jgi:2-dehydro-3-deoxygalactonokinase
MTGELFALLREHSILGRNVAGSSKYDDAFSRGVMAAEESPEGIAPLLFTVRSLVLMRRLAADASLEYLSGLLIGDEIRCGLMNGARPDALIGETTLCDRYLTALQLFDAQLIPVIEGAAQAGLFSIAKRAGLIRRTQ